MDILVSGLGQIVVDDVGHALDVEAAGSDGGGHKDGHLAALEVSQSLFAFALEPNNRIDRFKEWVTGKVAMKSNLSPWMLVVGNPSPDR